MTPQIAAYAALPLSTAASSGPMVLPPHRSSDREVETKWPHGRDPRVPTPLREHSEDYYSEEHVPQVAGPRIYDETSTLPCATDQRHLFDIIESTIWREVELPNGDYEERAEFRAVLTCVRCGSVTQWDGTRTESNKTTVQVAPLVVRDLVAQHIDGRVETSWGTTTDQTSWSIYRAGALVGTIEWRITVRGRRFHLAAMFDGSASVEGPDPLAALRRLERATRNPKPTAVPT